MRYFIERVSDNKFLANKGWTRNIMMAIAFFSLKEATGFAKTHGISGYIISQHKIHG